MSRSGPPGINRSIPPGDDEATIIGKNPVSGDASERDRAYLIVLAGQSVGAMFRLEDKENVVGRGTQSRIRINDEGISRKHARLFQVGRDVYVEDLGSANGTLVNNEVIAAPRALKDGDKIHIGSTTILKFTYHDKLEENFQQKIVEAALRDSMTKVYNKRYFMERLTSELAYARRHKAPLSVVMFDVDFFKKVNDSYGHLAGDYVLTKLAAVAQSTVRAEDCLARYGGEEFGVVCRALALNNAGTFGERLRQAVEGTAFEFDGKKIPVTISVGVGAIPENPANTIEDLIKHADEALYQAKRSGRNRVILKFAAK